MLENVRFAISHSTCCEAKCYGNKGESCWDCTPIQGYTCGGLREQKHWTPPGRGHWCCSPGTCPLAVVHVCLPDHRMLSLIGGLLGDREAQGSLSGLPLEAFKKKYATNLSTYLWKEIAFSFQLKPEITFRPEGFQMWDEGSSILQSWPWVAQGPKFPLAFCL